MEITREDLHKLVDHLPECEWEVSYWVLLAHLKQHDPLFWRLMTAPEDDEEETEEERLAVQEGREDIRAGRTVSFEEVKKRFGISLLTGKSNFPGGHWTTSMTWTANYESEL